MVDRLGQEVTIVAEPLRSGLRLYLDTADWRLNAAGWTMELEHGTSLTLRETQTDEPRVTTEVAGAPTGAGDLPPGPAWDRLRPVVEGRCLLVQLSAEVRSHRLAALDREGKTTARVELVRYSVGSAEGHRVVRYATVFPVRGYDRSAARIVSVLDGMGLRRVDGPLIVSLLAAAGRPRPGTNLGPGVPLDRSDPAARAIGAILDRLRTHVLANEEGVRHQRDTEFLHDYRVAIRRARSIVRQAAGILPSDQMSNLAAELGWLGGLTSPPRDLDVHLEELATRGEPEIEPLRTYLVGRRREIQGELVAALDSERYKRLLDHWQTLAAAPPSPEAPDARRPAGEVADEHVARAFRRVIKRGRAIEAASAPEALHDLRKRAKELRYLLECFQTLYPEKERSEAVKELKLLQDNLGEYQDCQVQAGALRVMAEDLMEKQAAPAATLMTLGRLAEDLERRERQARDEFEARFARFSSAENRKRYEALTGKKGSPCG